jgi:hypothetical protein
MLVEGPDFNRALRLLVPEVGYHGSEFFFEHFLRPDIGFSVLWARNLRGEVQPA